MKNKILSALLAGTVLALTVPAHADTTQVFTSFSAQKHAWYVHAGGVTALSGENISSQDGWLARLGVGYGEYSYTTVAPGFPLVPIDIDGQVYDGDLMIGYQHFVDSKTRLSAYLGGNWENQDLDPSDPNGTHVEGSRGGVKGQLEIWSMLTDKVPFTAIGAYSSAFRTYWTTTSVGYDFGGFTVGPEVGFQGNRGYNEFRYGAAISDIDVGFAKTKLIVGGEHNTRRDASGMFGSIGFSRNF